MIGEMILGKALFSGTSTINQLEKIIEVLGIPTPEEV
jgi:mitogen-activated protein kinase 15